MALKKEAQPVLRFAIVLFMVGVLCYAAFPQKIPDDPVRIMMKNLGGKVLFQHNLHVSVDIGYGLDCVDCHHEMETDDPDEKPMLCDECHNEDADEDVQQRTDAFHEQCDGCHLDFDIGPEEADKRCVMCHAG